MKRLWAPWRLEFIKSKGDTCIFCSSPREGDDRKSRIFARRKYVFGMLNAFPYNPGHILIAPYRHVTEMTSISSEEWRESLQLLKESTAAIKGVMEPHGFNIGFNVGAAAGGGFEHLHMHVVPRWRGDSNFMPVLAETKVLPEHLDSTYKRIVDALKEGHAKKGS